MYADLRNKLLGRLPNHEWLQLKEHAELAPLAVGDVIYEPGKPIEYVYFPETGIISLLAEVDEQQLIEVATVGNEGFVGMPVMHDLKVTSGHAFVQASGMAFVIQSAAFRKCLRELPEFRSLLNRYAEALFCQIAQTAACNSTHSIEQRCARWLLLSQDRMNGNEASLREAFVSQMLGTSRTESRKVLKVLEDKKLISLGSDLITVTDRAGLEDVTCSCYDIVRQTFNKYLNNGSLFAKR
ncbi:MAG TPA: Crp/Fnr family transcriptional regulator [Oculatellaceae cyanobacterium]